MSGFGAPARTATPRPAEPMFARVAATILRCPISPSSTGGFKIATSNVSPLSIFLFNSAFTAKWSTTLFPVVCSNWEQRAITAARPPLPLKTLSSAA
jgi:hypothetical protein